MRAVPTQDVSRPEESPEVLDADGRPTSLGGRIRLAFRADPTKGLVVLVLFLLGLSFLVAGIAVFWEELLNLVLDLFR